MPACYKLGKIAHIDRPCKARRRHLRGLLPKRNKRFHKATIFYRECSTKFSAGPDNGSGFRGEVVCPRDPGGADLLGPPLSKSAHQRHILVDPDERTVSQGRAFVTGRY